MSEPQTANDSLLNAGVAALRAGQTEQARSLLGQVVRSEPGNERAWLFLAGALSDDTQRRYCLERVLSINPQSAPARRGLSALTAAAPPTPATPPAPVQVAPPLPTPVQVAPPPPTVTVQLPTPAAPPLVAPLPAPEAPAAQPFFAATVAPPAVPAAPAAQPTPPPAPAAFSLPMLSARFEPAVSVEPPIAAPAQPALAPAVTTPPPAPPAAPQTLLIRPPRPANRLVWGVVLALGLMLMLSSTIYAALLLRG